jgi:hypothetical protein
VDLGAAIYPPHQFTICNTLAATNDELVAQMRQTPIEKLTKR